MLIAQQIAYYLSYIGIANYSELNIDGDTYIDMLPEYNNIIAIYNRVGSKSDTKLGYQLAGIQIIYRGNEDPIESYQRAQEIYDELHGFSGFFISNESLTWGMANMEWILADIPFGGYAEGGMNHIVSCLSNQGCAERIGISENGMYEYSINFIIDYKNREESTWP